MIYESVLGI